MMRVIGQVGQLAHVRFVSPFGPDELSAFMAEIRATVTAASGKLYFVTDWRQVIHFSTDEYDTLVWIMRRDNPKVEANAVLLNPANAPLVLQVKRMLLEAANPKRVAFTDSAELRAYLHPNLSSRELAALDAILLAVASKGVLEVARTTRSNPSGSSTK